MKTMFTLYRFDNPNGTQKDWAIAALPDKVVIKYGSTGEKYRTTIVPLGKCSGSTANEAARRRREKEREGYWLVGVVELDAPAPSPTAVTPASAQGSAQASPDATVAAPPAASPKLYWSYTAPTGLGRELGRILLDRASEIADVLKEHGVAEVDVARTPLADDGEIGHLTLTDIKTGVKWGFGVARNIITGSVGLMARRGSGVVNDDAGLAPILFLFAMKVRLVGLTLADDRNNEVDHVIAASGHPAIAEEDLPTAKRVGAELDFYKAPLAERISSDNVWFF